MQDDLARTLGPLDGARIPGGCEVCDAYQTVAPAVAGVWTITVHHDDWCPQLARMARAAGR
jgi:hypothetical protein